MDIMGYLKGLSATLVTNYAPYYYRTHDAAEIDLVLEGPFGILPIEIKYGQTVLRRQLRSLTNFINEHQCPFGMVINQSEIVDSNDRTNSSKLVMIEENNEQMV